MQATPPGGATVSPGRSLRHTGAVPSAPHRTRRVPRSSRRRAVRALGATALLLGGAAAVTTVALTRRVAARALVVRTAFDRGSRATTAALHPFAPPAGSVTVETDIPYSPGDPDALLDVYAPSDRGGAPLPTVVWVHGGGWLSGARNGLETWARILAARGFTVVVPGYSLAPAAAYPRQLQQVLDAVEHLRTAPPVGVDPTRLFLAGDSAGASLVAQLATVVTHRAYGEAVGVTTDLPSDAVAGLALCCGPYDLGLLSGARGLLAWASTTIGWAYLGTRGFASDPRGATLSLVDHVYPGFPPVYLTGGNGDPLTRGAVVYAERLAAAGAEVETLFFDDDYTEGGAPLGHEYQFDLRLAAARRSLEQTVSFLTTRSAG